MVKRTQYVKGKIPNFLAFSLPGWFHPYRRKAVMGKNIMLIKYILLEYLFLHKVPQLKGNRQEGTISPTVTEHSI